MVKTAIQWAGRQFYLMEGERRQRLWEIVSSERKFSAQLVEVKSPEREALLQHIRPAK